MEFLRTKFYVFVRATMVDNTMISSLNQPSRARREEAAIADDFRLQFDLDRERNSTGRRFE